jgi:uncharacterized OB-fold protein
MPTAALVYPHPVPTPLTQAFWEGCRKHKLMMQQCTNCKRMRFYPCEGCPHCRSTEYQWTEVSGRGSVYSWIVVHRSVDPVWQARAPFVTGIVELEEGEGVLVPGIILGVAPEAVREGMKVKVEFEQTDADTTVPRWRVVAG